MAEVQFVTTTVTDDLVTFPFVQNYEYETGDTMNGTSSGDSGNSCSSLWMHVTMVLLFAFGSFGNILSVVIMQRRALRERNYSPALRLLAFFNTLTLLVQAFLAADAIFKDYFNCGSVERFYGEIGCKLSRFFPTVIQMIDHWMVVFITAQRFVPICMPKLTIGNAIFSDTNTTVVFSVMFAVIAMTQMWRPFMDTMIPAIYENETMLEISPATCGPPQSQLRTYFDIDFFFHQFALLFFFPAFFILIMNIGVIAKLYQSNNQQRKTEAASDGGDDVELAENRFLQEVSSSEGPDSFQKRIKRIRKATVLLLAVTCTFWLYIMPSLLLLTYVVINDIFHGRLAGAMAFRQVCREINITGILATFSCADFFIIQYTFDDLFRLQLKLMIYRLLARCSRKFRFRYIKGRRKHRNLVSGSSYYHETVLRGGAASPTSPRPQIQPTSEQQKVPEICYIKFDKQHQRQINTSNTITNCSYSTNHNTATTATSSSVTSSSLADDHYYINTSNAIVQYPSRLVIYLYIKKDEMDEEFSLIDFP